MNIMCTRKVMSIYLTLNYFSLSHLSFFPDGVRVWMKWIILEAQQVATLCFVL